MHVSIKSKLPTKWPEKYLSIWHIVRFGSLTSCYNKCSLVENQQLIHYIFFLTTQFGSRYLQFCTEVGMTALKKDRFLLDASKIRKDDSETEEATAGLSKTCRVLAKLYQNHIQMHLVCEMVFSISFCNINTFIMDQHCFCLIKFQTLQNTFFNFFTKYKFYLIFRIEVTTKLRIWSPQKQNILT